MNEKAIQFSLAHIAVLIFTSAVLISQPRFAVIIAFVLTISLALCCATALVSIRHLSFQNDPLNKKQHATLLANHAGGAFCYIVSLSFTFSHFS